jgi:hypothetical protein
MPIRNPLIFTTAEPPPAIKENQSLHTYRNIQNQITGYTIATWKKNKVLYYSPLFPDQNGSLQKQWPQTIHPYNTHKIKRDQEAYLLPSEDLADTAQLFNPGKICLALCGGPSRININDVAPLCLPAHLHFIFDNYHHLASILYSLTKLNHPKFTHNYANHILNSFKPTQFFAKIANHTPKLPQF